MIGLFDSGVGGLSVYRQLKQRLPHIPVVYVADTQSAPYGGRAPGELMGFATELVDFLLRQQVSHVVIGCNTVSANAYPQLRERYPQLPLFELIASAVAESVATSRLGIGYLATAASVTTGVFKQAVATQAQVPVYDVACPTFVPLVEAGQTQGETVRKAVLAYLQPLMDKIDCLVLGCTHYPFLAQTLQALIKEQGVEIRLIDPAQVAVRDLQQMLGTTAISELVADVFYTTGDTSRFDTLAHQLIGKHLVSRQLTLP